MTNFATELDQRGVAFFAHLYIGGIPYIFSNRGQPTAWTDLGDYTWSNSLILFRPGPEGGGDADEGSFAVAHQMVSFGEGYGVSSQTSIAFAIDLNDGSNLWVSLVAPEVADRSEYFHDSSILMKPSRIELTLNTVVGLTAGDFMYSGLWTGKVRSILGSKVQFEPNVVGSQPAWFGDLGGSAERVTGVDVIRTWPKTWAGREVRFFLSLAHPDSSGVLVPLSSGPGTHDEYCREMFRGLIHDNDDGTGNSYSAARFSSQGIEQVLERQALSRKRVYKLGPSDTGLGWMYIEENKLDAFFADISQAVTAADALTYGSALRAKISVFADLGEGLFSYQKVLEAIIAQLNAGFSSTPGSLYMQFSASWVLDGDVEVIRFSAQYYTGGATALQGPIVFQFNSASLGSNPLAALGATQDVVFQGDPSDDLDSTAETVVQLDRPASRYYLSRLNSRIYYRDRDGFYSVDTHDPPLYQGSPSSQPDQPTDFPMCRLGKQEIIEVQFRSTSAPHPLFEETTAGIAGYKYATIKRRGLLGTGHTSQTAERWSVGGAVAPQLNADIFVEAGKELEDENLLHLGLAFEDHRLLDVFRWLAHSNGDQASRTGLANARFNVLPEGYGAAIDPAWFDHDSFDRIQDLHRPRATGLWIEAPLTLRTFIADIAIAYGFTAVGSSSTGGYKLTAVSNIPVGLGDVEAETVDEGWFRTEVAKPTQEDSSADVVNVIWFEYDRDPLTGGYRRKGNQIRDPVSIKDFGPRKKKQLRLFWLHGQEDVIAHLASIASWYFMVMANPPLRYRVPSVTHRSWRVAPGSVVKFQHDHMLDKVDGGVGIDGLAFVQSVSHRVELGPQTGELVLRRDRGFAVRRYVVNLRLLADLNGGKYSVAYDRDGGGFSESGQVDLDDFYAKAADEVWETWCYIPGQDAYQARTVSAVDLTAGTITLSSALTGDLATSITAEEHRVVVQFAAYSAAMPDRQEEFAFNADENTLVFFDGGKEATRWV